LQKSPHETDIAWSWSLLQMRDSDSGPKHELWGCSDSDSDSTPLVFRTSCQYWREQL